MKQVTIVPRLVATDASCAASGHQDHPIGFREQVADRDGWMARQRDFSVSLSRGVSAVLRTLCNRPFVVRRGVLLEHAPGTRNPATWIDCLAATEFGVFIIDQYHWRGAVERSVDEDEVLIHERPGVVSVETSPLRRAKPALRHLRAVLTDYNCPVECIAVLEASQCAIDPTLPETILVLSELPHFMRSRLNRFRGSRLQYLDPQRIAAALQARCTDWGRS
ncbi:nuclease-related domain-containing protein [Paraburkholderia sp. BR10954]|uniref:nuclease-related domain-containing protein n=1 Tax=Paraburkholderia sp. BR10954 TaxID=3236995 RepID=UPI0034D264B8